MTGENVLVCDTFRRPVKGFNAPSIYWVRREQRKSLLQYVTDDAEQLTRSLLVEMEQKSTFDNKYFPLNVCVAVLLHTFAF